ncbi:MAG: hypothetical protein K6A61_00315 [Butyrivibrio sp.]|nr:hypothetical protein [Butyrivibrio sp.]
MPENNSRTSLFLMELIIAVFFFSLAAAVSIRLFVGAHKLTEKSTALSNATIWSQSLSEAFYECNGDVNKIAELFPSAYITENAIILFFDKEWNVLEEAHSDASYEAILVTEKADASSVYSDIKDYGSSYSGKAAKGNVAVLNIKDTDEVISSIPKDQDIVIISYTVDTPLSQKESK